MTCLSSRACLADTGAGAIPFPVPAILQVCGESEYRIHGGEAYWFGEGVMPELRKRGALTPQHQREAPLRVSA